MFRAFGERRIRLDQSRAKDMNGARLILLNLSGS